MVQLQSSGEPVDTADGLVKFILKYLFGVLAYSNPCDLNPDQLPNAPTVHFSRTEN